MHWLSTGPMGGLPHHTEAQTLLHSASVSGVPGARRVLTATDAPHGSQAPPSAGTAGSIREVGQPLSSTPTNTTPTRYIRSSLRPDASLLNPSET